MTEEFRIQHSVKTRAGDMLNVRASTPEEFAKILAYVRTNISDIAGLGDVIRAAEAAGGAGLTPPASGQASAPAPQPQASPPSNAPVCQHGQMTFRSGNSAKGPWKGYFCPTPKGTPGQCEPQFIR